MNSMKEFKNIADEEMKDITVTSELKERTLINLKVKKPRGFRFTAVPAMCAVAILVVVGLYNSPLFKQNINPQILMKGGQKNTTMEGTSDSGPKIESHLLKSLEEARKYLDGAVLIPSYVPKGFKINEIYAINVESEPVKSIWLYYISGDKSLSVSIEKNGTWGDFKDYEDVSFNDTLAHMKSEKNGEVVISEIRWFKDDILYSVTGVLTGDEVIDIAKSLK